MIPRPIRRASLRAPPGLPVRPLLPSSRRPRRGLEDDRLRGEHRAVVLAHRGEEIIDDLVLADDAVVRVVRIAKTTRVVAWLLRDDRVDQRIIEEELRRYRVTVGGRHRQVNVDRAAVVPARKAGTEVDAALRVGLLDPAKPARGERLRIVHRAHRLAVIAGIHPGRPRACQMSTVAFGIGLHCSSRMRSASRTGRPGSPSLMSFRVTVDA